MSDSDRCSFCDAALSDPSHWSWHRELWRVQHPNEDD